MVSPRSGRCGDVDTSFCFDIVGANVDGDLVGDAVGRSEGADVGRSVALTGDLVGAPGVTVGLKVFGCSLGGKDAGGSVLMADFSSLLSRMVKTHANATIRPTRKKMKAPAKAGDGLLILFL
mmetsp:Transcript_233/g.617  ORF Transcript_233/g.617 Transcript_233/m.617 type:complete len:122 (-) Transcript_233:226-591(-)